MSEMALGALGRRAPETWQHVERYALAAAPDPGPFRRTPIVLGINWYEAFDQPELIDGRYWIGHQPHLGQVLGGHAILVDHGQLPDRDAWWHFYNQGGLNACVGYSMCRAMTQLYKGLFDPVWLWDRAKEVDPWGDTNPGDNEGTSLDAGAATLFSKGAVLHGRGAVPNRNFGVSSYRWATSAEQVLNALDSPLAERLEAVPLLNSWGPGYRRVVWLPLTRLTQLLGEDGEACVLARVTRPAD